MMRSASSGGGGEDKDNGSCSLILFGCTSCFSTGEPSSVGWKSGANFALKWNEIYKEINH